MSVGESYGGGGADGSARERASRLPEELRALGRSLDAPGAGGSESMVERVLEQILAERLPVPVAQAPGPGERLRAVRRWTRMRWRSLAATLCGLLAVLALTPPVRAAVLDWFEFGGVEVRYDPSAVPSPGAEVPGCGSSVSLAQAERRAGFEPLVPSALGAPDVVTVTAEPRGRSLVSLCWRERGDTIRLDEYRARLDIGFAKSVREQPEWLSLDGDSSELGGAHDTALWFPRPHLLSFWLVDTAGSHYTREQRTAGATLLWMHGSGVPDVPDVTLRLEGVASKARAVEIAKSLGEPGHEGDEKSSD
ncbi:hypothetical protein OOK27_28885 [Streptomyces canus]|uniref:hypothetical protein n=1 Tax=Streptomyces canus TaxID=58343 RepID=UPI0022595B0F|nr:hypothetical protein [Streptomyces canus]MCX5258084.1 hypothetical protein [Streptomyces canus]